MHGGRAAPQQNWPNGAQFSAVGVPIIVALDEPVIVAEFEPVIVVEFEPVRDPSSSSPSARPSASPSASPSVEPVIVPSASPGQFCVMGQSNAKTAGKTYVVSAEDAVDGGPRKGKRVAYPELDEVRMEARHDILRFPNDLRGVLRITTLSPPHWPSLTLLSFVPFFCTGTGHGIWRDVRSPHARIAAPTVL